VTLAAPLERPGRVLGVDPGERRVGLSLSDETRLLASPLRVLLRGGGANPVMGEIARVAAQEGAVQVVVGLPLNEDGTRGRQAHRAEVFADTLAHVSGLPVELWDERLSTRDAEALARAGGRSTRRLRERGEMDALAAAVILQDYLDRQAEARQRRERLSTGHVA